MPSSRQICECYLPPSYSLTALTICASLMIDFFIFKLFKCKTFRLSNSPTFRRSYINGPLKAKATPITFS